MSGRSLLRFYDDPPGRPLFQGNEEDRGSRDIAPLDPAGDALFPRRINQDEYLCSKLMQFASNYLSQIDSAPPHSLMEDIRVATDRALSAMHPGDEMRNIDVFTHIFNYIREYVAATDRLDLGSIQTVACGDHENNISGCAFNRVIQHRGKNHVLIENISLAALERYQEDI